MLVKVPNINIYAEVTAAALLTILSVHFSNSYFSYALGIWLIFMLYNWKHFQRETLSGSISPVFNHVTIALCIFYGAILLDSIFLWQIKSFLSGLDYMFLSAPFFMLYILRASYSVDQGAKWGITIGSLVICIGGFLSWDTAPGHRMLSFFAHPNHFGTAIALLLPFLVYYIFRSKAILEKISFILLSFVLLFCLYHTESRGAMMALGAAIGSTFFLYIFHVRAHLTKQKIIVFISIITVSFMFGIGAVCQISSERTGLGQIGGERLMMLEASYQMWNDHKLLGIGLANWEDAYYSEAYHPEDGREQGLSMPHNMPAYFFSTAGIIGGLGYLTFIFTLFYALYQSIRRCKDTAFALAAMTAFLAFSIQGLVDTTIINKIPSRLFFGLMGYYLATYINTDNKKSKSY